ncbi:glycosyltransferase [Paenibacillus alkaliterrae]|uniref:glycosyltransferase n=1 Tax=Paenibacillus alkaliterrae TaxID=320909 RepID=UPI001F26B1B5|nr:glycosyltransferase [Paenibacillus alkaliterrae]MCF2937410.1 glycosyltransferase [Paenibacillus alkaliterrae]
MKKKLLFVMNNLNCGGAEKSLISLLQTIDYAKHEVDLYLFKHEGMFFNKLPKEVNLLNEPPLIHYFDMPIKTAVMNCMKKRKFKLALSRIRAGYIFKTEKNNARCEQRVWKYVSNSLQMLNKEYDAAIGYLEKSPVYFVIEKVRARTKIGFIHSDYDKLGMDPNMDSDFFQKLNYVVTVSEECVQILKERFPMLEHKIKLMHNIVSPAVVTSMSFDPVAISGSTVTITSVGRLNAIKGFSMAIEACERLVKDGYDIRWFIVGEGQERRNLEILIKEKNLQNAVILAGQQENPYPYMKACDLYVQTSLFEGHCLTVTEAKILRKPIVSTNFKAIYEQLSNEKNGLIVEQDAVSIYKGIKRLIDNENLRNHFVNNLKKEELGTENEIIKLYQWIG